MSKPTTKRTASESTTYRQRAAQARAAAGQPQPASLPRETAAESRADAFRTDAAVSQDPRRGQPEESGRADAAGGPAPRGEQDMGRHESFENATPIAAELLAGTMLARSTAGAEAELLRLGARLDDAIARVRPLQDERSRSLEAGWAARPVRPACLFFRAEDQPLKLRRIRQDPEAMVGSPVSADDIAWMRQKPIKRAIPRAVRPEDGLPADAETVVEAHPWPEAQARADEILAAWDSWHAGIERAIADSGEHEAEERAEAVEQEILELANRIASLPASTADGLRIKLRAVAHYEEEHDEDYPAGRLLNSLLRDATKSGPAPHLDQAGSVSPVEPDPVFAVIGEFQAAWDAAGAASTTVGGGDVPDAEAEALVETHCRLRAVRPISLAGLRALAETWAWRLREERATPATGSEGVGTVGDHAADSLIASVVCAFSEPAGQAAAASDDAALLVLEARFLGADAAHSATCEAWFSVQDKFAEPPMPKELRVWRSDWIHNQIPRTRVVSAEDGGYVTLPYGEHEVEQIRGARCMRPSYGGAGELQPDGSHAVPDQRVQERVDGIVAAWDQWQAQIRAAREAVNLPALVAAKEEACDLRDELLRRIRETPARGMMGLAIKARVAANMMCDDDMAATAADQDPADGESFLYALAGDVLALTGWLPGAHMPRD